MRVGVEGTSQSGSRSALGLACKKCGMQACCQAVSARASLSVLVGWRSLAGGACTTPGRDFARGVQSPTQQYSTHLFDCALIRVLHPDTKDSRSGRKSIPTETMIRIARRSCAARRFAASDNVHCATGIISTVSRDWYGRPASCAPF